MAMNVKWKYEPYAFYNKKGIEERLSEMAEQGWFIEKMGFFWKYRKGTPAKRTYNVVYVKDPEDADDESRQQEFVDYCEAAGWKRCFVKKCMLFFYYEGNAPTPIETEAEFAIKNIHKAMKAVYFQRYLSVFMLALMYIFQLWMNWKTTPFHLLASNYTLFFIAYFLMGFLLLIDVIVYYQWRRKALQIVDDDDGLPMGETTLQRMIVDWSPIMVFFVGIGVLLFDNEYGGAAIICAFFTLFFIIYRFDERKRNNVFYDVVIPEKRKHSIKQPWGFLFVVIIGLLVTMGVVGITVLCTGFEEDDNADLSPVTYEDLLILEIGESSDDSYYERESFLIKEIFFDEWIEKPVGHEYTLDRYFSYRIVEVKVEQMYDFAFEKYCEQEGIDLTTYTILEQEGHPKVEIYHNDVRYLILWNHAFADISFSWQPTDEQLQIVIDKLDLND